MRLPKFLTIGGLLGVLLVMPALACGGSGKPAELGQAAQTAVSSLEEMGENAGTAASQLATSIPTLKAAAEAVATLIPTLQAQGEQLVATAQALSTVEWTTLSFEELEERFANVQVDENGSFTITMTAEEWNQAALARQTEQIDAGTPPAIQNITFTFTTDQIGFAGTVVSPLTGNLSAQFHPTILDGNVQVEVIQANFNSFNVPAPILNLASDNITNILNQLTSHLPDNLRLTQISVSDGTLLISGQQQ